MSPIRESERDRYPADWPAISKRIRARSGGRCEWCGRLAGDPIGSKGAVVALTTAHLDHTPENCADGNLAALCQRCHLTYDAKEHAKHARETWRKRKACGDLFDGTRETK